MTVALHDALLEDCQAVCAKHGGRVCVVLLMPADGRGALVAFGRDGDARAKREAELLSQQLLRDTCEVWATL